MVDKVLGSPAVTLDTTTRRWMESWFGHDFSRVRIHADARAAESARALGARAYTVGNDIVFGDGHYAPGAPEGRWLIAHELTHTIQQGAIGAGKSSNHALRADRAGRRLQRSGPPIDLGELPPLTRPEELGECLEKISGADIEAKSQQAESVVVIEISAAWCGPCKILKKVLNELCHASKDSQAPAYRFYEVDFEESEPQKALLLEKYEATSLPRTLLFAGGKLVDNLEGLRSKAEMEALLQSAAARTRPKKGAPEKDNAIQPKLLVGQPGDELEQEADRVADAVVNESAAGRPAVGTGASPRLASTFVKAQLAKKTSQERDLYYDPAVRSAVDQCWSQSFGHPPFSSAEALADDIMPGLGLYREGKHEGVDYREAYFLVFPPAQPTAVQVSTFPLDIGGVVLDGAIAFFHSHPTQKRATPWEDRGGAELSGPGLSVDEKAVKETGIATYVIGKKTVLKIYLEDGTLKTSAFKR